jgi:hypothetical protein
MVHGVYSITIIGSNFSNKLTPVIVIQLYVFQCV